MLDGLDVYEANENYSREWEDVTLLTDSDCDSTVPLDRDRGADGQRRSTSRTSQLREGERGHDDYENQIRDVEALRWPNRNFEIFSKIANCLALGDADLDFLISELSRLDPILQSPKNSADLRRSEVEALKGHGWKVAECPVPVPVTKGGEKMVQNQSLELFSYDFIDLAKQQLSEHEHAKWLHWRYEQLTTSDGETVDDEGEEILVNEMWTTQWWKQAEEELPGGEGGDILCLMFATDETQMTKTGQSVQPMYIFFGNIHRSFRNQKSGYALGAMLPIIRVMKAHKDVEVCGTE